MSEKLEPICFTASVTKIASVAEGGFNLSVHIPESELVAAMAIMPGIRKVIFKFSLEPEK